MTKNTTADSSTAEDRSADQSQSGDFEPFGDSALGRLLSAAKAPLGAPAAVASWAESAGEFVEAARSNRGVLTDLVRLEVERVVGALGMVTPSDVVALRKRISDVERKNKALTARVKALETQLADASPAVTPPQQPTSPENKSTRKNAAKKISAKKTSAKKAATKKTAAKKTTAAKTSTKKAAAAKKTSAAKNTGGSSSSSAAAAAVRRAAQRGTQADSASASQSE